MAATHATDTPRHSNERIFGHFLIALDDGNMLGLRKVETSERSSNHPVKTTKSQKGHSVSNSPEGKATSRSI